MSAGLKIVGDNWFQCICLEECITSRERNIGSSRIIILSHTMGYWLSWTINSGNVFRMIRNVEQRPLYFNYTPTNNINNSSSSHLTICRYVGTHIPPTNLMAVNNLYSFLRVSPINFIFLDYIFFSPSTLVSFTAVNLHLSVYDPLCVNFNDPFLCSDLLGTCYYNTFSSYKGKLLYRI